VPDAAILVADLAQAPLCIGRADSVFRICQRGLAQRADSLDEDGDQEVVECADALGQEALFGALQRGSAGAFRLCLKCCADLEIAPQLSLQLARFAEDVCEDLDPEMHAKVAEFLARAGLPDRNVFFHTVMV
jgi:hypothetical protein